MPYSPDGPETPVSDPWATSDGLPSDFEGTISEVEYFRDPKYNAGQTLLAVFTIQRLDGEPDVESRYTLGPGWTEVGNSAVTHDSGPNTKFNKQTQYGELVSRIAALLPSDVRAGRDPHKANAFKGLTFYWERVSKPYSFTNSKGEHVEGESTRLWPTRYLGIGGAAAQKPVETKALGGGGLTILLPAELADQVLSLAKANSYSEWGNQVLSLPGALSYDELVKAVSEEAFYNAIRGL